MKFKFRLRTAFETFPSFNIPEIKENTKATGAWAEGELIYIKQSEMK